MQIKSLLTIPFFFIGETIQVSWDTNQEPDVIAYKVKIRNQAGSAIDTNVVAIPSTQRQVLELSKNWIPDNGEFKLTVIAIDAAGSKSKESKAIQFQKIPFEKCDCNRDASINFEDFRFIIWKSFLPVSDTTRVYDLNGNEIFDWIEYLKLRKECFELW